VSRLTKFLYISVAIALVALTTFSSSAEGHSSSRGSRPYYGGGHHTQSHGGTYRNGHGSSHRGGHYKNPRSVDRYGRHK
jgi:hypothetical protein